MKIKLAENEMRKRDVEKNKRSYIKSEFYSMTEKEKFHYLYEKTKKDIELENKKRNEELSKKIISVLHSKNV